LQINEGGRKMQIDDERKSTSQFSMLLDKKNSKKSCKLQG
jgi:hypothetical protein